MRYIHNALLCFSLSAFICDNGHIKKLEYSYCIVPIVFTVKTIMIIKSTVFPPTSSRHRVNPEVANEFRQCACNVRDDKGIILFSA